MTSVELSALLPLIVVAAAALVVLLVIAFARGLRLVTLLTLLGLILALIALPSGGPAVPVGALLVVDSFARLYMGLVFVVAAVVAILAHGYLRTCDCRREEFYALLLLATFGSAVLVASSHFASFFLGLEILSVSLYTLVAYPRVRDEHIEAGLKYLVLAGASSAFLLFGMALTYADSGTLEFSRIAAAASAAGPSALLLAGTALVVVGVGFKLAVVPFHMWTPDVYQGAPAPTTALVATVSKGAVFAVLLRYFVQANVTLFDSLFLAFAVIAVASMLIGNLLALLQSNVKRLLAYSSIAHLGYALVAFLAAGSLATAAVTFYLVAYFITILGAFGVVTALSSPDREAESIADYRGLAWRRPWLAGAFTAMLLSLAGIPLTAGFIGKFYVVGAGVGATQWLPVLALVIASTIGLFYYLRLAAVLYQRPEGRPAAGPAPSLTWATGLTLAALTLLLVWVGVNPSPLLSVIQAMVGAA